MFGQILVKLETRTSYLRAVHTSCQTFSISDIPFRITVIYGPLNDLSKIYRLLWVLTKTLNIHWILEEAPQTNLLYFVTSNIRFFQQQKKNTKEFPPLFFKKMLHAQLVTILYLNPLLGFLNPPSSIFRINSYLVSYLRSNYDSDLINFMLLNQVQHTYKTRRRNHKNTCYKHLKKNQSLAPINFARIH